jgi:uncharacterized tellurite resistance protein B-like protein
MNQKLEKLFKEVTADGKIDGDEVAKMKKVLYEDGKIDQEEADFLFKVNDTVSDADNHPGWRKLFIQAISDFLLKDETSPGEVDKIEATWLINKIQGDGVVDGAEKELLLYLHKHAKKIDSKLEKFIKQWCKI